MMLSNRCQLFLTFAVPAMCLAWTAAVTQGDEVKRYDNHKIIQIDLKTQADLDAVRQSGAIILDCRPGLKPTQVIASPEQFTQLEQLGRRIEILHENAQAVVDADKRVVPRADVFDDFFLDYHPWGEVSTIGTIPWYMNELVTRYSAFVSMSTIGGTIEARDIPALRITNDLIVDKPGVVYFCDVHAREWITPTACLYLADHLMENYGTDPQVTDLVDNVEIFIVPVVNVDGYIYSWDYDRWWRKNRRNNGDGTWGVDLNRNWGYQWGYDDVGSSPYTDEATYRGTGPFSEPETQALRDFFYAHPNVRTMMDVHNYGELILWPWGYIPEPTPDSETYWEVGSAMQSLIYDVHGHTYAIGPGEIYSTNGASNDWGYGELGMLSLCYELRPVGYPYFELPADEIIPNNEEITPANLYLLGFDWVRAAMRYSFPGGIPGRVTAGSDTTIDVNITSLGETVAPGTERLYHRFNAADPFTPLSLTSLGGGSYQAVLPAASCAAAPEFYFSATGDGGTTLTSPNNAPAEGVYSAAVVTGELSFYVNELSTNPGWSTEGLWGYGAPTGGGGEYGNTDPTSGHTGANVYGYNLSGDYENNLPERDLTSAAIDCTGQTGIHLKFWRWLNVEQPAYDRAHVRVSNNGIDWVTVWANYAVITDNSWTLQDLDISAVADNQPTLYLRWTMGPTDGAWRYSGWNIDDVELAGAVCQEAFGPPVADGVPKNRYVSFTAGPSAGVPQAFRVTTVSNPLFPAMNGEQKWVGTPDENGKSPLVCAPVYRNWNFAYIDIADKDVVPGASYTIEATLDGASFLPAVPLVTVPMWGDVVHDFIDGAWEPPIPALPVVDFNDISAMVDRFRNLEAAPPMSWCDVQPAYPDAVVDFSDIGYVVDAFRGDSYLLDPPTACE